VILLSGAVRLFPGPSRFLGAGWFGKAACILAPRAGLPPARRQLPALPRPTRLLCSGDADASCLGEYITQTGDSDRQQSTFILAHGRNGLENLHSALRKWACPMNPASGHSGRARQSATPDFLEASRAATTGCRESRSRKGPDCRRDLDFSSSRREIPADNLSAAQDRPVRRHDRGVTDRRWIKWLDVAAWARRPMEAKPHSFLNSAPAIGPTARLCPILRNNRYRTEGWG